MMEKPMIRRLALVLAAAPLALLLPATAPVVAQQAAGTLEQAQAHLRSVETMTAAFTQTDRAGRVLTGTLTLKKPGKIRFQYEKGVPILIVGDGRALTFIDYSVKQVSRWPIGSHPLSVLLDPRKDMSKVAKVVRSGDPRILLIEANDPGHPEYGRITLAFAKNASAPGGLMLQGWVALDSQNNRTTIRLTNQKFNAPVNDRTFRYNDPRPQGARG
jgi:outer membrane lipoprotein-sorting protein